jgi:hypothetical protein
MPARRFTVLMTNSKSGWRDRIVVEADGPLAAAMQGYLAWSGSAPETVEVEHLTVLDDGERPVAVTVVSTEGQQFRLRVSPEPTT